MTNYNEIFSKLTIAPEKTGQIDSFVGQITNNKGRYQKIEANTGIPWWLVGAIHASASSNKVDPVNLSFDRNLDGSPLNSSFEEDTSKLLMGQANSWRSLPNSNPANVLNKLDQFGGNIEQNPAVWSGTNVYNRGDFDEQGKWQPTDIAQGVGGAAIYKRMLDNGIISTSGEEVTDTPVLYGKHGAGCIDTGVGNIRNLAGIHAPATPHDAQVMAEGLHGMDKKRTFELHCIIDVASIPEILTLEIEQTIELKGFGEGLDGTDWTVEEIIYHFGDRLELEIFAFAGDPPINAIKSISMGNSSSAPPAPQPMFIIYDPYKDMGSPYGTGTNTNSSYNYQSQYGYGQIGGSPPVYF